MSDTYTGLCIGGPQEGQSITHHSETFACIRGPRHSTYKHHTLDVGLDVWMHDSIVYPDLQGAVVKVVVQRLADHMRRTLRTQEQLYA